MFEIIQKCYGGERNIYKGLKWKFTFHDNPYNTFNYINKEQMFYAMNYLSNTAVDDAVPFMSVSAIECSRKQVLRS